MISLPFLSYCMKTVFEDGCVQVNEVPPSFNLLIYGPFFPLKGTHSTATTDIADWDDLF